MLEITPLGWLVLGVACLGLVFTLWCLCRVAKDPPAPHDPFYFEGDD